MGSSPKRKSDVLLEASDAKHDEESGVPNVPPAPFLTVFRGADAFDYLLMTLGTVGAIVIGASLPAFSIFFGDILNNVGEGKSIMDALEKTILKIVYLAIASFVGGYLESAMWAWTAQRQSRHLREQFIKSALVQNVAFFDTQASTGGLLQTLSSDTLQIQKLLGDKVGLTIHNLSMAVAGIVIGFVYSWDITLVILALMPLLALGGALIARITTIMTSKMSSAYAEASSTSQDALSNIRTVVAFNMQEPILERYAAKLVTPARVSAQQGQLAGLAVGLFNVAMFSSWGIGLYYGSVAILNRGYDGGDVVAAFTAVINGGFGLGQALPNFTSFVEARASIARLLAVIDKQPDYSVATPGKEPQNLNGEIEFQGVTFAYPSRPAATITKNLSLKISATQKVALVGGSGSGKSTVIALIQRWYDPLKGKVLLDGVDIRDLNLGWLRRHMGLVSQEPTLFATTIRANILFGRPGASQEEIEEAARAANIHKFIKSLPGGYDSMVGERGVQLSGGQKQRVAIARAILRSPKILLLDEATSALDAASEKIVQATLEKVMVGRTTVVVAHRLSTVRDADKICVIQHGSLVEEGSHDELLQIEGGAYKALIKLQNLAGMDQEESNQSGTVLDDIDEVPEGLGPAYSDLPTTKPHSLDIAEEVHVEAKKGWFGKKAATVEKKDKEEEKEEEPELKVPMSRLLAFNKPEWPLAVVGVIASGATGMAMPAVALVMSEAITTYYLPSRSAMKRESLKWMFVFIACGVGVAVNAFLQQAIFHYMGSKLAQRVREKLMRALIYQDIAWFDEDRNNSAALVARLSTDAMNIKGAVGDSMAVMSAAVVGMVFSLTVAFVLGWKLALVILATVPFIMFAGVIHMQFATQQGGQSDEKLAGATQTASEAFQAIRTVQAYGMENSIVDVYHEQQDEPVQQALKSSHIGGLAFGYSMAAIMGVYGLAFWYGGKLVSQGEINFGDMLKIILVILLSSVGVSQAQAMFPDIGKAKAAVQNVFRTLDRKPDVDASSDEGVRPADLNGNISLQGIVFAYPSRPTIKVFDGFDMDIPAAQTVAVVGESGSGKSTVISLVLRLYDPQGGTILIDGVDLRSYNLRALRAQMGLVQQEPILFNTTIRENIMMGRPDATQAELEAAARAANAHDFIVTTPQGYDTPVGERGGQLSGGQKQRIAIARAVLRNPRILLLDEATSALDATSEALVQEALDHLMKGRTTIVVAHRLSTIRNAHRICVVQTGVMVEQGTHDELLSRNGAYAALVKAQLRGKGGASMKSSATLEQVE